MTRRSGVKIDALGVHHTITAQCQTCWHTTPLPLATIKAKSRLARRGLLEDLNGYLRCTRCQSQVNNVLLVDIPHGSPVIANGKRQQ
ncbi:hypothetical protein [Geminicoccus flavidas]|uniref:hypothetical protein n=1 Tax=Geminicoccus flavidas TaxID=2506407 RepID=UPI001358A2EB|nr:hypothetical protein [Geminicoccus flavidas]